MNSDAATASGPAPRTASWLVRGALAVGAGLAWTAALPPIGAWWCGPLAVALLGAAARGALPWARGACGAVTGLVVFGATLRWATVFTVPGFVTLVLTQAAFVAVGALLLPRGRLVLALPAALTLVEWARHSWPLSGLPVSSLALGQASGPLLPLASLGGPLLVTFAVAAAGSLALASTVCRGRRRLSALLGLVALLVVPQLLPARIGTGSTGRTIDVAAVQGGGARGLTAVRTGPTDVLDRHLEASRQLGDEVDLVLWPENVLDVDGTALAGPGVTAVRELAAELEVPVVAGVTLDAAPSPRDRPGVRRFRNVATVFEPDGTVGPVYDKVVRVPFGEYVPARGLVERFADLTLIPRDAVPGSGPGVLDTSVGRLGVLISFEGLFADRARAAVGAGARALVVPTNASSYVTDDVPAQQVAAARLRAVETGRWVVIAGPTGPSAVVGPDGDVRARSALEEQTVVTSRIRARSGRTLAVRLGDRPMLVLSAGLLGAAWTITSGGRASGWPALLRTGRREQA